MFSMNSLLTVEERMLLQSLDCKDKEQAVNVLDDIRMSVPIRSMFFKTAISLYYKLCNENIDYAFEMNAG